jgi:hypothetical protein
MYFIGFLVVLFVLYVPCAHAEEGEPLFGLVINTLSGTLSMDVLSSGCTRKQDFDFDLQGDVLTIKRRSPDACKMIPHRVTLTYTRDEFGVLWGRTFHLTNPITVKASWEK